MRRQLGAILAVAVLVACGSRTDERADTQLPTAPSGTIANDAATGGPDVPEPTEPEPTPTPATVPDDTPIDIGPIIVDTEDDVRSITVGGMGAEYGPPVSCTVDLAVSARRATVDEASRAVATAADQLVTTLRESGVSDASIQTSQFWINPVYDHYDYQVISSYEATLGYRVTMPDVDGVGSTLAGAIAAGGDSVRASSIRFEADPADLMGAARDAAWRDVRGRAEATAELIGEPLGRVLDAHEKVLITSQQGMMHGGEGDAVAFDIPVSPGIAGVTVLLTVTYEIGE